MLKSYGWVGWVAHVIIVSAQSKELGFGLFRLRVRIWGLLGQGIGDLDSGLTITETYLPGQSYHHYPRGPGPQLYSLCK